MRLQVAGAAFLGVTVSLFIGLPNWTCGRSTGLPSWACERHANAEENRYSKLSKVTVDPAATEVVVGIRGSRSPDFTSFTLSDPYRVVVDWAGSTLDGVPPESSYPEGLVRKVSTRQFASESEKISRVTVELASEVKYRLETEDAAVLIRFTVPASPPPAPVEAEPEPEPEEAVDPLTAALDDDIPEGPLTEPVFVPPPPPPPPSPPVVAKAKPVEPPPKPVALASAPDVRATARDSAPKPPKSPGPAPSVAQPELEPAPSAPTPKSAAPTPPATKPMLAKAETAAPVPAAPAPPAAQVATEAPARVSLAQSAPSKDAARSASRVRLASRATAKSAADPGPTPVPDAPPAKKAATSAPPSAPPDASAEPARLAAFRPTNEAPPAVKSPPAPVPAKAPVVPTGPKKKRDYDPGPRLMKYIGFRQKSRGSEVFVRCDGKARYKVKDDGRGNIFVDLFDTKIQLKNNQRALDTSFFRTVVTRVKASPSTLGTRVKISVRENVPFQIKRSGSTLKIHFDPPSR